MARDNGKRGSYRHGDSPAEIKPKSPTDADNGVHGLYRSGASLETKVLEPKVLETKIKSPSTPTAPTAPTAGNTASPSLSSITKSIKTLWPERFFAKVTPDRFFAKVKNTEDSDTPLTDDGYFDSPSASLNDKYPVMNMIPGSMPARRQKLVRRDDEPTWRQFILLVSMITVVVLCFFFVLYTGVRDVLVNILAQIVQFGELIKGIGA